MQENRTIEPAVTISKTQQEIIKAALYFDIFNYPLTRDELFENSAVLVSKPVFNEELGRLVKQGYLQQHGHFIMTGERSEKDVSRRLEGNEHARKIMPLAHDYSRKIAAYPFVEAVFLSGSLSKNFYDEKSDIDFFIVTKPGRLWICRTLLILRYKLMPGEKKKYWCTNYFVSSESMTLPDVNLFTATELAYLIPTVNYKVYSSFLEQNIWYRANFPNKPFIPDHNCSPLPATLIKSAVEKLLGGRFGKWLDDKLLYVTLKRWQKKYPELAAQDFELQFRSRKNVCKRHISGFQNKVLKNLEEKKQAFEKKFAISLRK